MVDLVEEWLQDALSHDSKVKRNVGIFLRQGKIQRMAKENWNLKFNGFECSF